jgi:hypothetical protein
VILDSKGRKIKKRIAHARAVVFVSVDEDTWHPLHEREVPDVLKEPDNMAHMIKGGVISLGNGERPYYAARVLH